MSAISVTAHLLGPTSFVHDSFALSLPPASASLLALLLVSEGPVGRSRLADAVGGGGAEPVVRKRINTAVWRLRRALERDGVPGGSVVATVSGGLRLCCDAWVDVREFEAACGRLSDPRQWSPVQASVVARGLQLYRGDFLSGLESEWAAAERGRLADLNLAAMVRLAQWHRLRGEAHQVIELALRAVALEPLREELHRLLMRAYVDAGLPELAARQLDHCRTILTEELGVAPSAETVAAASASPGLEESDVGIALRALERSHAELRELARQLSRSLLHLDQQQQSLRARLDHPPVVGTGP